MTAIVPQQVTASLTRALWGEVGERLQRVQFLIDGHHLALRFLFDGAPTADELDSIGAIGAEVAADFSGVSVTEEALPSAEKSRVPVDPRWQTAYVRRESVAS